MICSAVRFSSSVHNCNFTICIETTRVTGTPLSPAKRWRSGESTRLPPMCPGFGSRSRRHMWVDFVVGSFPAPRGFSPAGTPIFSSPEKPTLTNFNSIWNAYMATC